MYILCVCVAQDKLQDHEEEIERLNGVVASGDSIQKDLRERWV